MTLAIVTVLVISDLVIMYTNTTSTTESFTTETTQTSNGITEIWNVTYCNIGGIPETLNVFLPANTLTNRPLVIYVHGGGWVYGNDLDNWRNTSSVLVGLGYVVASINYFMPSVNGSAPYGFPLNIEDVACAVRYMRASASEYAVDSSKIGLFGTSAGGNLVTLEALTALNGTFDHIGQYQSYSSKVKMVIDGFGPTNLTMSNFSYQLMTDYGREHFNLINSVFGDNTTLESQVSPINYVKPGAPPFLIIQGENDTVVPMSQSVELYNSLKAQGDSANIILVDNAGHGIVQVNNSIPTSPSIPQVLNELVQFVQQQMTV